MTMKTPKLPIDHEGVTPPVIHSFEPDRMYRYTWPGQKEATVKGSELAALVKGADVSMLDLKNEDGTPINFERAAKPKTNTELEAEAAKVEPAPESDHERETSPRFERDR